MINFKNTDRILIIGGTGFIGRHLVAKCSKETPFITCIGLNEKPDLDKTGFLNVKNIEVDISDKAAVNQIIRNQPFDYVFNLGGYIDHTPYFKGGRKVIEASFIGLMNIIDCLDRSSLKGFVHVGSSDEYGTSPAPQKESMREMEISPYSLAKTAGIHFLQMIAHAEGFPVVALRFFLVYGPGQDDKRFLPQVIKACLKNEEFKTSEGKQLRDFCYINDIVEAMIQAALLTEVKGRIINIGSGKPILIREMIEKVIKIIGKGRPIWGAHPYRKGENMELYPDITLASQMLNWQPGTSLDEGLQKTIQYYREQINEQK